MQPASRLTFSEVAENYIRSQVAGWRNEKHRAQWRSTIAAYCAPILDLPVDAVTRDDVLAILRPIWTEKAETASRLRGRIEKVLDSAAAQGLRHGENPARWRGNLELLLPRRQKLQRGHHPAMPFQNVPAFVQRLRKLDSVSARALEFIILTAIRSGCVLKSERRGDSHGMRWEEVDFESRTWTVPAIRMKDGKDFRLPLSEAALDILAGLKGVGSDFVFPGQQGRAPLSAMACEQIMRRLKAKPATVHGFRTSFRSWVAERTDAPDWVLSAVWRMR